MKSKKVKKSKYEETKKQTLWNFTIHTVIFRKRNCGPPKITETTPHLQHSPLQFEKNKKN